MLDADFMRTGYESLCNEIHLKEFCTRMDVLAKVTTMLKSQGRIELMEAPLPPQTKMKKNRVCVEEEQERLEEENVIQDIDGYIEQVTAVLKSQGRINYEDFVKNPLQQGKMKKNRGSVEEQERSHAGNVIQKTDGKRKIQRDHSCGYVEKEKEVQVKRKKHKREPDYCYVEEDEEYDEILERKKIKKNKGSGKIFGRADVKKEAPPAVPQELKRKILLRFGEIAAENVIFVIQKKLQTSDLDPQQNRFSIPMNQMSCSELQLVTEKELESLKKKNGIYYSNLEVKVMQPVQEGFTELNCSRWVLGKGSNKASSISYVLKGPQWHPMAKANGLKEGKEVQCWGFRDNQQKLCFALHRVL